MYSKYDSDSTKRMDTQTVMLFKIGFAIVNNNEQQASLQYQTRNRTHKSVNLRHFELFYRVSQCVAITNKNNSAVWNNLTRIPTQALL